MERDAERWWRESKCDMLKNSKEACSEAWGAYHTGNEELPDYIAKYIEEATAKPIVKKSGSGIIKRDRRKLKMDLQLFGESDIKRQDSNSLKRAIRKYEKRIAEHEDYIKNPLGHCPDWNKKCEEERAGLMRHWKKEIRNFNQSISERIDELKERGDYDD